MADIPLRQIRAVIAVCEEGSFTRAAQRENATQSGISQHVAAVERTLGVKLFERSAGGRDADAGGPALLQALRRGGRPARDAPRGGARACRRGHRRTAHRLDADVHARGAGAGARRFRSAHPEVRLHIVEGYSGVLTEMVLADELDFAVVPAFEGTVGLRSRLLVRDREMLMSGPRRGLHAARAGAARGLRAAQDRRAGAGQYPPPQSRNLFPDPRRRDRGHARDGRDDRHARIRRALRLGDDPAERDLGQRHRPRRTDRQSDRRTPNYTPNSW